MTEVGRAAVLRDPNGPVQIEEYPVPDPEPGGLIVRIEQAGVCGSDLNIMRGMGTLPPGGRLMGHEGYGTVHRLGSGLMTDSLGRPLREGDRVIHSAVEPCYRCSHCLSGEFAWCPGYAPSTQSAGEYPYFFGTFADFLYLEANRPVFLVPDGIPESILTFVNCALGTVTDPLLRIDVSPGDAVVVMGAGGLGLTAVAMLSLMGCQRIIAIDRQRPRLDLARAMGAHEIVDVSAVDDAEDRVALVRELTGGGGADVVMELVGHPALMEEGLQMLANGGTFVQIGLTLPGAEAGIAPVSLLRGKTIMGSIMYRPRVIPMLLDLLSSGRDLPPLDQIVSRTYKLTDVNVALDEMEWRSKQIQPARASIVP